MLHHLDKQAQRSDQNEDVTEECSRQEETLLQCIDYKSTPQMSLLKHTHLLDLRQQSAARAKVVTTLLSSGYPFWKPDSSGASLREVYITILLTEHRYPSQASLTDILQKMDAFDREILQVSKEDNRIVEQCCKHSYWPMFGEQVMSEMEASMQSVLSRWNSNYVSQTNPQSTTTSVLISFLCAEKLPRLVNEFESGKPVQL